MRNLAALAGPYHHAFNCGHLPVARTRIKICGLTRRSDVGQVVSAGVDAVGFVFYPSAHVISRQTMLHFYAAISHHL